MADEKYGDEYLISLFAEVIDKNKLINNPHVYTVLLGYAIVGMTNLLGPNQTQLIVHKMLGHALAEYTEKQLKTMSDEDMGGLN